MPNSVVLVPRIPTIIHLDLMDHIIMAIFNFVHVCPTFNFVISPPSVTPQQPRSCPKCGLEPHPHINYCPAINLSCWQCGRRGYISRVCRAFMGAQKTFLRIIDCLDRAPVSARLTSKAYVSETTEYDNTSANTTKKLYDRSY